MGPESNLGQEFKYDRTGKNWSSRSSACLSSKENVSETYEWDNLTRR